MEKNPIVDKVESESKNDPKQNIKNVNETNKYSPNKNDFFVALATLARKILNDFFQTNAVSKFIKNKNYRVKREKSQEYVIFPNLEAAIKRNGFIFIYHTEDDCINAIQKGELTLRAKEVLKNI